MPTPQCYTPILACRLRVARLDAAGAPLAGADNLIVTDGLIQVGEQVVIEEGAAFTQKNGCGTICLTYQGRDKIKAVNLTLQLCYLDAELIEMMTGAHLVTVDGATRGYTLPDVDEELDQEVSVEAWSVAWDGDQQATLDGDPLYIRHVWPRTTWVVGDRTFQEGPTTIPLTGRGNSNSEFGDGPANDLPWGEYVTPAGEFYDNGELPDSVCGYQALVAS